MLAASTVVPAWLAAAHVGNVAGAAHDEGTVRVLGLGWTGLWRAADVLVAAPFLVLPLGTLAARAAAASAVVCGVAGALLYVLARRLLASCGGGAGRLSPAIAAVASLTATLSAAWQLESTSLAGSGLGALLCLAPLALASRREGAASAPYGSPTLPLAAFVMALAVSYEPVVGLAALASIGTFLLAGGKPEGHGRGAVRSGLVTVAAAAVAGLFPLALSLAVRRSTLSILAAPLAASGGEGAAGGGLGPFLHVELGWFGGALAAVGLGIAFVARGQAAGDARRARGLAAALLVLAAVGLGAAWAGAALGPARYCAPVLAALGALWVLAGVTMEAAARAVAKAPIPLASASATMIIVIELTFPVLSADDALQRLDARGPSPSALWDEVAFGQLPARAVVLVREPRMLTRILSSRATGELRGDLSVIPLGDIVGPLASRELTLEPKMAPLWRDLLLEASPDEWALSSLSTARPLALPFEPQWERPLARHFVPAGLFAIFEPEPRGASDRLRAMDAFAPDLARLVKALRLAPYPPRDAPKTPLTRLAPAAPSPDAILTRFTAALLLDRAITFASTGERELATRALDDARPFAPDPVATAELARRLAQQAHGPVDVKGLAKSAN